MTNTSIKLHQLIFEGVAVDSARIKFGSGLSIIYGASNTGKSFVLKALDFMFGGSKPLPDIQQRRAYDNALLGLTINEVEKCTFYRALAGGEFTRYNGILDSRLDRLPEETLAEKHNSNDQNNISQFLLRKLGYIGKQLVKNKEGEKRFLTFRDLAPYLFIAEDDIISDRSPILSGQLIFDTVERNVFKLLMTGRDDSMVVASQKRSVGLVARKAKVEVVSELIAEVDSDLGSNPSTRVDVEDQLLKLHDSIESIQAIVVERQREIDRLAAARRAAIDVMDDARARLGELRMTVDRFRKLEEIYASDLARLQAIEEGGGLLLTRLSRNCPVCGASPEHQLHSHSTAEIHAAHRAADVEMRKIVIERRDLTSTVSSLESEAIGLEKRIENLKEEIDQLDEEIANLRPLEAQSRATYQDYCTKREEARTLLGLLVRREDLLMRKGELERPVPRRKGTPALEQGIDGATADAFAKTVEGILNAWRFPGKPRVVFDLDLQDIRIDGKPRSANGKGVRALLHAAFNIGVLLHCKERGLPHPGFVVLDTPLLTYREPLSSRFGELSADEEHLKQTNLNEYFYEHLIDIGRESQVIIIENSDPTPAALKGAEVSVFTSDPNYGRFGLFASG